jgi:hypothetical protein
VAIERQACARLDRRRGLGASVDHGFVLVEGTEFEPGHVTHDEREQRLVFERAGACTAPGPARNGPSTAARDASITDGAPAATHITTTTAHGPGNNRVRRATAGDQRHQEQQNKDDGSHE